MRNTDYAGQDVLDVHMVKSIFLRGMFFASMNPSCTKLQSPYSERLMIILKNTGSSDRKRKEQICIKIKQHWTDGSE